MNAAQSQNNTAIVTSPQMFETQDRAQSNGTMTAAAKTNQTQAAAKRPDKNACVPFEEMCRLMRVYGSTKCLRKRQPPCGKGNMKVKSVKRKFYRWFPDLEERFVRDAAGFYRPRFGHEFEMRYREDLRAKDGAILSRKRNDCRRRRYGTGGDRKKAASPDDANAAAAAPPFDCAPVSPASFRDVPDVDLHLGTDDDVSVVADAGPLDGSFVAEWGIFDDVERSFFGLQDVEVPTLPALPLVPPSSQGPRPGASREGDGPSVDREIDGLLDGSMEEFCEATLLSDGDDGCGPVFSFDAPLLRNAVE